jgi:Lon protease-like protein
MMRASRPYELMIEGHLESCHDPIARYNAVVDTCNSEQHRIRNILLHRMNQVALIAFLD